MIGLKLKIKKQRVGIDFVYSQQCTVAGVFIFREIYCCNIESGHWTKFAARLSRGATCCFDNTLMFLQGMDMDIVGYGALWKNICASLPAL